jgi:hypothetical protein
VNVLKENIKYEDDDNEYDTITIILYADSLNNVIAGSMYDEDTEVVKLDKIKNTFNITINLDDTVINITRKDDNTTINIEEDDTIINLDIYTKENDNKINYEINIDGTKLYGILEIDNIEAANDTSSADFLFNIHTSILGKDINASLEGTITISKALSFINEGPTNTIELKDLSEEELLNLYNKLSKILDRFGLSDLIS